MPAAHRGLGVSSGIAIGQVYLLHVEELPVVPDPIPPERVNEEIERFQQARGEARRELQELKNRVLAALGDHYAGILEAQLLILDDTSLVEQTIQRIRIGRVSARWAIKDVVGEYDRKFAAMDETHLRDKGGDLSDVHLRLQRLLRGEREQHRKIPDGPLVVVAHSLGPADAVDLARKGVVGLASDVGGRTSHTAILAQALSVPAVAGLHDLSQRARAGEPIILDGSSGEVVLCPSDAERAKAVQRRQAWIASEERAMARAQDLPVRTADGVEVFLRANIEFPSDADNALRFGAQGIGLYRSEFLFLMHSPQFPSEEEHYRTYRQIARAAAPHPAVIRTLDLGGEKYFHQILDADERNPVLGLRAVRLCLKRPDIFRPQLRGLLRAAVEENVRVMLPLVTTLDEIREVRRLLHEQAEQLKADGVAVRADVPLGIMIEVPAAAVAADVLADESDFFSLGTNDLIQYALAIDRGNESVDYLYQPLHPGVQRLLLMVVEASRRRAIPLSICGEMAADPDAAALLVGIGLREFSMQPRAIAGVREALSTLDTREAKRAAESLVDGMEHGQNGTSLQPADVSVRRPGRGG